MKIEKKPQLPPVRGHVPLLSMPTSTLPRSSRDMDLMDARAAAFNAQRATALLGSAPRALPRPPPSKNASPTTGLPGLIGRLAVQPDAPVDVAAADAAVVPRELASEPLTLDEDVPDASPGAPPHTLASGLDDKANEAMDDAAKVTCGVAGALGTAAVETGNPIVAGAAAVAAGACAGLTIGTVIDKATTDDKGQPPVRLDPPPPATIRPTKDTDGDQNGRTTALALENIPTTGEIEAGDPAPTPEGEALADPAPDASSWRDHLADFGPVARDRSRVERSDIESAGAPWEGTVTKSTGPGGDAFEAAGPRTAPRSLAPMPHAVDPASGSGR